jgi:hypothetical protein
MSAVVEAIGNAVGDVVEFVGDVGETVVQAAGDVVEVVGDVAEGVVQGAVEDPLGTIAKVGTAIYAPYLLPVVTAGVVVANGGDIDDALKAGAISWATQGITSGIETGLADTAFGEFLGEVAQSTGIEALPQIASRGIGQAVAGTASGLAQGQDIGDALTRGLTSGIGSTVGGIAGSEADTGFNVADRLIGQTIGGGTTAALRGRDFETGAGSALASGLIDIGAKEGIKGLRSLESPVEIAENLPTSTESVSSQPLLASGATATDASLTPTEEVIQQMRGKVTVYDPETGLPVKQQGTPEEEANLQALIEALYPETQAKDVTKIDEYGNAYDVSGQLLGNAEDFGLMRGTDALGKTAYITPSGELVASSDAPSGSFESQMEVVENAPTTPYVPDTTALDVSSLLGGGEMEGDYPEKIINNPDGSTTVIEFDGTQRIFNIDGSVTTIEAESEEPLEEFPREPLEETPEESSINLGNLANSLLSGFSSSPNKPTRGGSTRGGFNWGALAAGGAGLIAGLDAMNQPTQESGGGVNRYGFDWRTGEYMAPVNAVAYGQRFVNPEYYAAEGGLMSIPQYINPTVPNLTFKQPQDPTASVYMYAQGGLSSLGHYSDGGRMLKGPGDGMSDDIPATIAGRQPARLANEEFVIPADVVSHLGNGSSEAGAKVLYDMMARVRKARTGNTRQGKQINPDKFMPKGKR